MIVEALTAILLGGGALGSLAGWLLIRYLEGRRRDRRGRVVGVAESDALAGETVRVRMGPPELPPAVPRWPESRPSTGPPSGREFQILPLDPTDEP